MSRNGTRPPPPPSPPSPSSLPLRDVVQPGISGRSDFPLRRRKCALLVVDVQAYLCPSGPAGQNRRPADESDDDETAYYREVSFPPAVRNIRKLAEAFRAGELRPSLSLSPP